MALDVSAFVASLPPDAIRVRVKTALGTLAYRKVEDLVSSDEPLLTNEGTPVIMRGNIGAPSKHKAPAPQPALSSLAANAASSQPQSSAAATPQPVQYSPPSAVIQSNPQTPDELETQRIEELRAIRRKRHPANTLLKEVKKNPTSEAVFDLLMASLAEESELIEFERDRMIRLGQPATLLTEQRLKVIRMMTDSWAKKKNFAGGNSIDIESPAFGAVFSYILETIRASMEDAGMRSEFIETVFAKLSKRLDDSWKMEAILRIKEKS